MADYRRLVSYMYNYENGIKRNNVGYVRVEVRNGQCKITISIKALSFNNTSLKSYIFKHLGDKTKCYSLGESLIKNGNGELRLTTNSSNIVNSGYSLDDMAGIVVYSNHDKFFATEWDDNPIVGFDLDEAYVKSGEKGNEKIVPINGEIVAPSGAIKNVEEVSAIQENIQVESRNVLDNLAHANNSDKNDQNVTAEENKENKTSVVKNPEEKSEEILKTQNEVANTQIEAVNTQNEVVNTQKEAANTQKEAADTQKEAVNTQKEVANISSNIQELIQNIASILDKKSNENQSIETASNQSGYQTNNQNDLQKEYIESKQKETINEQSIENQKNMCLYPIDYTFFDYYRKQNNKKDNNEYVENMNLNGKNVTKESKIFDSYPKLNPFEDSEILDCIKIEPQDIGIFPMEFWVLGNNSFLLHAYYNYRHLLLAKRKKENEPEYILGVPGIYENKEKFIANMFGFFDFKGVSIKKPKTGDFGYWLLDIKL